MYPVSERFIEELHGSNMQSVVRIVANTGDELLTQSGSVSMDVNRDIGRTCTIEFTPTDSLSADEVFALLISPGLEITVWRGLVIDGAEELVPLGVFSTDTVEFSKIKSSTINWAGSDRAKKIARNRFVTAYQVKKDTLLAQAGWELLQARLPNVAIDFSNVLERVAASTVYEGGSDSNPWQSARELFGGFGYDLRFDGLGVARAIRIADPNTVQPVFDFGSGETAMILDGSISASLESVYNGVIVTGEGTSVKKPVRAEAWDNDPMSPTYVQGGFGRSPYFYSSPLVTSAAIAQSTADSLLAKVKGRFAQFGWPSLVNPALEPLDVVEVEFDGRVSVCVIDSLTVPLTSGEVMSAQAREMRIG